MQNEIEILKKRTQAEACHTLDIYTENGVTTFDDGTQFVNCRIVATYNGFLVVGEPHESEAV